MNIYNKEVEVLLVFKTSLRGLFRTREELIFVELCKHGG